MKVFITSSILLLLFFILMHIFDIEKIKKESYKGDICVFVFFLTLISTSISAILWLWGITP